MYTYYQLVKDSKDPVPYRAELEKCAIEHGNKPATWKFETSVKEIAKKRRKRINAVLIKRKYNIPYSTNTILKVMYESGFLPQKHRKYQRKRDLRELKKMIKPFEKIQVDNKYLDDILKV